MPIIDMNYSEKYCERWNIRQATREVVANAEDVRRAGGSMSIEHNAAKNTLTVVSVGQYLTSRALIFGLSEAKSNDSIGKFGDGLKVALGVFLRYGCPVKINTGREIWIPRYVDRDGARIVGVTTRALPAKSHRDSVVFEIGEISASDWAEWRRMFLFLTPAVDTIQTEYGIMIRDADRRGCVFCRGVLVDRRPGLQYGYDIPSLTLNRDREVADEYEVTSGARLIWSEASHSAAGSRALYDLLSNADQRDVEISTYNADAYARSAGVLKAQFVATHGATAVPVSSSAEVQLAAQNGLVGVIVPRSLRSVLHVGGVADLARVVAERRESVEKTYSEDELTPREVDAMQRALTIFAPAVAGRGESMPDVRIVDFAEPGRLGLYVPDSDKALIARSLLSTPSKLYGVLAHEIAHRNGADGDASHRAAIEDLMGRAIAELLT